MNRPHATEARTNSRDGYLYDDNGAGKNYEPNSYDGPAQTAERYDLAYDVGGVAGPSTRRTHARTTTSVKPARSTA